MQHSPYRYRKPINETWKIDWYCRRIYYFCFIAFAGHYSIAGLLITAKSILRFRSTQKNEYILVGTMLSFGLAILTGILIRKLI